ncbi:MAG TPA: VOC family protein [Telluria sp.]|nr:VOC family protein [Telluria sp.]
MSAIPKLTTATVTPCLRYRDAPAAIDWLCAVFGFERHLVVPGDDGSIRHAQLSFGNGMIMLGSAQGDNWYGKLMAQPDQIDGRQTQTICLVVNDADLIYQRVKAAGVEILQEIEDASYGGRGFSCRDLEGHVWTIGTYDPWQH